MKTLVQSLALTQVQTRLVGFERNGYSLFIENQVFYTRVLVEYATKMAISAVKKQKDNKMNLTLGTFIKEAVSNK